MPIVIGALGTVNKGLIIRLEELEIRGQVVTIQITALRSARILRRVLETCCHSNSSENPSANAGVRTLKGVIMIIILYYTHYVCI